MRTENDLRAVMSRLADDPPDAHDVLTAVRATDPRPARRRMMVGIAVATTLAAVAVPVTIRAITAPEDEARPQPSTRQPNQNWRQTLSVARSSGFEMRGTSLYPGMQSTLVDGPGHSFCEVLVFRRGAFDSRVLPAKRMPVTVQGTPGWYVVYREPNARDAVGWTRPRIAWEYAADSWTVVTCTTQVGEIDEKAVALRLANVLSIAPRRLAAPFAIGYLPPTLTVCSLSGDPGEQFAVAAIRRQEPLKLYPRLLIDYWPGGADNLARPASVPVKRFTVNGRAAELRHFGEATNLIVTGAGFEAALTVADGLLADPEAELRRIADGLTFAPDPKDGSTWFDATLAIP
jgi:hypothetical protein